MATPPPAVRLDTADAAGLREPDRLLSPLNAHLIAAQACLARGLTFAENFAGEVRTVELGVPDDWRPLALKAGWAQRVDPNCLVPAIRATEDGCAELRGLVTSANVAPSSMATIPDAYLPEDDPHLPAASAAGYATAVARRGSKSLDMLVGNATTWLSLYGLGWKLAGPVPPWAEPYNFSLKEGFPGKPSAVLALLAVDKATGLSVACGVPAWDAINTKTNDGKNRPGVSIRRVPGLVPGRKYLLTLLVLGG